MLSSSTHWQAVREMKSHICFKDGRHGNQIEYRDVTSLNHINTIFSLLFRQKCTLTHLKSMSIGQTESQPSATVGTQEDPNM